MANQQNSYTGSQGTGTNNADFSFTFPSFTTSEVKVEVDNVVKTLTTHYTVENFNTTSGGTVRFTAGNIPTGTTPVRIFRQTDVDNPKATFTAGSSLKAGEINDNFKQVRHALQEAIGAAATDRKVQEFNIEDGAVTTAKIKADNITSALIADDQIDSEHYVADSIDSEHYAPGSVDTAAIGASQVTTNELATDSVNTTKIIDLNVTRAKLENDAIDSTKLADDAVNSEHYVDGSIDHVHLANDLIDGDNIQDDVVNSEHIAAGALDNEHYAAGSITSDKLSGATVITSSEQAAATTNDTSFLTSAAADARFFNISTGDTIKDGDTFPDNDTTIATTAAINDRIIDLVDDVGGFVPIANETSFPNTNPDVNDGAGTIVSISTLASNHTSDGNGVITISNGTIGNSTVTVNGAANNTTYSAGYGLLVETTTTLNTYTFHRLVPRATEITTVAGISGNVTTVAGIAANTTTVAGISADVTTVAGIASNVTSVAGNASNINSAVSNASNINSAVANASNINTVAGSISNVNSVGGSIASVNSAAANLSSIATYGDQYQVASSNPSTDGGGNALAEGDLYFNTTANELKIYNGGQWQGGVTASGNFAATTGNTFTGDNVYADNAKLKLGTGSDLEIFHNANDSIINDAGQGTLKVQSGGNTKLEVTGSGAAITGNLDVSSGLDVTGTITVTSGNITVTGNVDGRDLSTDGTKLDGIEANAKDDQTAAEIKTLLNSDGIVNSNVDAAAAIAGTKIAPNFGSQDIVGQKLDISHATPTIELNASSANDWSIINNAGTIGLYDQTNGGYRLTIGSDGHVVLAEDKYLRLHTFADIRTKSGSTTHVTQNSLVLDADHDIWLATSGNKITFGTSDSTAHEVMRVQCAAVGASQHGYVDLNYVVANAGGSASSANRLKTTETGITLTGDIIPDTTQAHDLGSTSKKWSQVHADYFHGNGTNLTSLNILTDNSPQLGGDLDVNDFNIKNGTAIYEIVDNTRHNFKNGGNTIMNINAGGVDFSVGHVTHVDSMEARFGSGNDLKIYHDGNHSILDNTTGNLQLKVPASSYLQVINRGTGDNILQAQAGGSVELFDNGSKKLETTNTGVSVTGALVASGDVTAFSDARLKTDIHTINDALGTVGKLRGVNYKWLKDGKQSTGLIAQEVEAVIPEVVTTNEELTIDGVKEVKSIDYGKLVGVLIEAVKELKAEVDELKGGK